MKARHLFFLFITCFIVQQCAKQTAPTGGPKDETPPSLVESDPEHEAVNFKGEKIELTFDELVQLNNPREQVIITPSIGKKFEVIAKKNRVILTLNSKLEENTTYNVNFRESIEDVTERNPSQAKLAFSTGPYIDSLEVNGTVKDILSDKNISNFVVALAPATDTFNISKHAATWITLTHKQGRFSIENLKPGNYFIYAFEDKNRNLTADTKTERYGFKAEAIDLKSKLDSITINTFKLDASQLKLIASRITFAYFNIRFSKSLVDYKIISTDTLKKIYSTLEPDLSTIKVYNTIPDLDSLQVRVEAQDSINSTIDTLVYIKFPKKEATRDKFNAKIEFANQHETTSMFSATVNFTKPVIHFVPDSMYIQVDSVNRITFTESDYQWNQHRTTLAINKRTTITSSTLEISKENKPLKKLDSTRKPEKRLNQLTAAKGTFISVENDTAAAMTLPVQIIKPEDTAVILVKIETKENFIIQVINTTNQVVKEAINARDHKFENLPAATYILRLVIDLNKNGKWDAGDFNNKREPEPVLFYRNPKGQKEINLKANWEVGPLLIAY